jgi:hypothetical protein
MLTRTDILDAAAYESQRDAIRRRVMRLKDLRRVLVGDHCSVHFENRDILSYQVHEMLRAEGSWTRAGAVEDELRAYNPLLPGAGELSATLMFEYETADEREEHLPALLGIDRHLWLVVGDAPRIPALFDAAQIGASQISAVQFVRWRLAADEQRALGADGTVVRIVIDHPHYTAQAVLGEHTRKEIAGDVGAAASAP